MCCPTCGREVPLNASFCPNCSTVATPGTDVSAAPAHARPPSKYSWAIRLGAWALSAGCWYTIVMMGLLTIVRTYGPFTAETFLRLIVRIVLTFLLPLIGVSLYYRKKTPRPPLHRKVLLVSAFAMGFSILASGGSRFSSAGPTKERIGILYKEGAGLLPVSPDQSVWDSPVRSSFADISDFSRRYREEANQLDLSALNPLFSAESFRDSKQMEKVLTQLRTLLALEKKYASLDPILERNKTRIRSVDAPDSVKDRVLSAVNSSVQKGLANRSALYAKTETWIQSSIDLYEFTLAKRASYALRDGKLVFKDPAVMSEFNQRLKEALAQRADALQAQENFEQFQKETSREFNIQPSDAGFSQESRYFKAERGVGATYLELAADGLYKVIDREHMGIFLTDEGRWQQNGAAITFNPKDPKKTSYQATENTYRRRVFLAITSADAAIGIVITADDTKKAIDDDPNYLPDLVLFKINAQTYSTETKENYPFRYIGKER